jgi:hypothetical protein
MAFPPHAAILMDFSMIANAVQVFGVLWTLAFGSYALHEVLSRSSANMKLHKKGMIIFFVATIIILLIAVVIRAFTWVYVDPQPGNLDLQAYCTSLGYQENSQNTYCVSPLQAKNLNDACSAQNEEPSQTFLLKNPDDPTTGYCVDAAGKPVRGPDVDKYCSDSHNGGSSEAVYAGNAWKCELKVNMQVVCIWMNSTTNIQASEDNITWSCHKTHTLLQS